MTPMQKERVLEWARHVVSSFNGHTFDDMVRQSILYGVRSALAAGVGVHEGMAEAVVVVTQNDNGVFEVDLADGEIPPGAIVIDMNQRVSADEMQQRINALCSSAVQSVHGLGDYDKVEVLRGLVDYLAKTFPREMEKISES